MVDDWQLRHALRLTDFRGTGRGRGGGRDRTAEKS